MFLTSPNIKLDWAPGAWLENKLSIDSATAERVNLIRLPKMKSSAKQGPILPGFDIHVGDLRVDHLDVGAQVGGQARSGSLHAKGEVHSGRALVEVAVLMNNGGDHIVFHLDAEPDRNKFDASQLVILVESGRPRQTVKSLVRSTFSSAARAAGRAGAATQHSTFPENRRRD